jgi:hypothetical protein
LQLHLFFHINNLYTKNYNKSTIISQKKTFFFLAGYLWPVRRKKLFPPLPSGEGLLCSLTGRGHETGLIVSLMISAKGRTCVVETGLLPDKPG